MLMEVAFALVSDGTFDRSLGTAVQPNSSTWVLGIVVR